MRVVSSEVDGYGCLINLDDLRIKANRNVLRRCNIHKSVRIIIHDKFRRKKNINNKFKL